jgi:hypothetical protein
VKHTKEGQAFVYHPIIDRRRLRLQEEIACDDWTLLGANDPKNYANLLTRLAANHRREPLLASGVSRSGKQLYHRVSRILDRNCNRRRVALRAVSGPIRKHVMIRTKRGMIDKMDPDELGYARLVSSPTAQTKCSSIQERMSSICPVT